LEPISVLENEIISILETMRKDVPLNGLMTRINPVIKTLKNGNRMSNKT